MAVPGGKWSASSAVEEGSKVKEETPRRYKRVRGGSVLKLEELTFEEFCQIPMEYSYGYSTETEGYRVHKDKSGKFGLVRMTFTKRNPRTCEWGNGITDYKLTFDDRYFRTPDQLYVAYMEYACNIK